MNNVRLLRLQSDYETMRRLIRLHPHIETEGVHGNPPEVYRLFLSVRTLQQRGEKLMYADRHRLEIKLPRGYPRDAPICRMLTPVFHPNIAPHAVCITDNWSASESLSSVVMRVCEMLAFQSYNIKSPLNGEAAQWAAEHLNELPTDRSVFFLDLENMPEPQTNGEQACGNCGGPSATLACAEGHVLCENCVVDCGNGHQPGVCLVCGSCSQCMATECKTLCGNCGGPSATLTCAAGHLSCENCVVDCGKGHQPGVCLICGSCSQCVAAAAAQQESATVPEPATAAIQPEFEQQS